MSTHLDIPVIQTFPKGIILTVNEKLWFYGNVVCVTISWLSAVPSWMLCRHREVDKHPAQTSPDDTKCEYGGG